jgi:hypothetical protein
VLGLQLAQRPCFAAESLDFFVVAVPGQQHLDDHTLVELGVERIDQEPVLAAEDGADAVLPGDEVSGVNLVGSHG